MVEEKRETFVSSVDTMGRIQIPPTLRTLFEIKTGKGVKDDRLFRVTIEEAKK
jgi:bifunctional DNA-binding transcriptional regulator/antitoxin component of YhaV-PrlF toxin-antitoxin module